MIELRRDPLNDVWVIFSPERKLRPQLNRFNSQEELIAPKNCPFCEGNESMTPPEIFAIRDDSKEENQPGWTLRVIPNKFPALREEGRLNKQSEGLYDMVSGVGSHEVVIETQHHCLGIDQLEFEAVVDIFLTFKQRIVDLKKDKRCRYIQIFKNHGVRAGATIPHPHSQIVAMPVIPTSIKDKIKRAKVYFKKNGRCPFCDIIHHEREIQKRILFETSDYLVVAPYASRLPFGLIIYPRNHQSNFEETTKEQITDLTEIFIDTLARMNKTLENPAYNLILHNCSFDKHHEKYFHWHLELLPITSGIGGFEMGTYTYINSIPPEDAIAILKKCRKEFHL